MRGHIRRRGEHSYEYIVDVGMASAQRCQACGRRFWLERKPKANCPSCGGELAETEERRRAIKGGFATRRECEAALTKILAALEAQTFTPLTKVTVKQFLLSEWLPTVKSSLRPTTYSSCDMLTREHILPRLGALQLQRLSPAAINALCAHLLEHGRVYGEGGLSASSVRRVHAVLHKACRDAVRWGGGSRLTRSMVVDPPRARADPEEKLRVWNAEQLGSFLGSVESDRLFALWRLLAATGMRRGEAIGLAGEDLDMEAGAVTIRRAWIPVDGVARFSEPKSRRSRRTIALDP
jgi:integrase/predicted RNA-binding Zn-ribbon protein involved in translation (DUF1610 family)